MNTSRMTSEYIRASVAYRIANGDAARSSVKVHAIGRTPGCCSRRARSSLVEPPADVPGGNQA